MNPNSDNYNSSPLHDKSETNSNYISAACKTPRSNSSISMSSKATLNDDTTIISEAVLPSPRLKPSAINTTRPYSPSSNNNNNNDDDLSILNDNVYVATEFDESSAAEDFESFNDSTRYENAEWALLSYSRTNKWEKLNVLLRAKLQNKVNLNLNYKGQQKKNYSWSALHLACYFGHIKIVELLLSDDRLCNEINLNIQNISGDTPLHKATLTNRVQIVQLLLSHGANVFIQNNDALLARQVTNNRDILQMLQAAEQNDRNRIKSDLFKAVDNGDLKTLQTYIRTFNNTLECEPSSSQPSQDLNQSASEEEKHSPSKTLTPCDEACAQTVSKNDLDHLKRTDEPLKEMTDERGNTLLHVGAMRGFKAICVYLLEQGLDPYRRNGLGQTCFDLSSNQLKQLFSQVKPTDNRLQRLSKQRISRFEGPLLKKVRILGWKQIYVILENGVILLYNNKRDSRNKSRRGYKYLESATCELDKNEIGVFTICFSDKSKATFAISSDHLQYYSTLSYTKFTSNIFNNNNDILSSGDQHGSSYPASTARRDSLAACRDQIELIRQKWFDSLADHIQYSTEFIRKGLKLNDHDEEDEFYATSSNVARPIAPDQLIPVDTMKSFVHESRAHYSILERHSEFLYSLVQQINENNSLDRYSQSIDVINDDEVVSARAFASPHAATTTESRQQQEQNSGAFVTTGSQRASRAPLKESATSELDSNSAKLNRSSILQDDKSIGSNATSSSATTTTANRLFGFIGKSRQQQQQQLISQVSHSKQFSPSSSTGKNNRSQSSFNSSQSQSSYQVASNFLNNDWPSVLFHLRLLLESAQRTKDSMGHTISLMEHQEHLRQTRLHDLEEKCRVLENSILTLARDHHELEKSVSASQFFYQSNSIARSMSMSTDMNEYFDAFSEFDEADRRTLTPANSMPSDESLNRRIQEVLDDEDNEKFIGNSRAGPARSATSKLFAFANRLVGSRKSTNRKLSDDHSSSDGNQLSNNVEDEDLQSQCSALTVETLSEATPMVQQNALVATPNFRTKLPATMVPRDQISFWSILKNCIGKELYKITMPVVFNEPLTMLQRACECIQYANLLKQADLCDDPTDRMELICTFIVAGLSANCYRIVKPFNPLLYETYEITDKLDDGSEVKAVSQQVSHHPPISACYAESDYFIYHGSVNPKIKFWGRTIEILPDGHCRIHLKRHNENYIFKSVSCSIHNIIVGKIWFEHTGPLTVKCPETQMTTNLDFKQTGWFGNDLHRFDGIISNNEKKKVRYLYGKWSDYMKSVPYSEYEHFLRNNQKKSFRIPDVDPKGSDLDQVGDHLQNLNIGSSTSLSQSQEADSTKPINTSDEKSNSIPVESSNSGIQRKDSNTGGYTKSESSQSLDLPNSKTLWRLKDKYLSEYYNFTLYTLKMNELTPELAETLPRTDSRYRTDVRKLEEGDIEGAASEKERLEEKQRAARAKDKRFKEPSSDYLFFNYADVDFSKEKFWIYSGNYWDNRANAEKFPDIF